MQNRPYPDAILHSTRQHGKFSYYREDGEPTNELDWINEAEYRILENSENGITLYRTQEPETEAVEERFKELRSIDRKVLKYIKNGEDDIQKITSATDLSNLKVNYSFKKLEKLGFIQVEKTEEPVERVINGQKRVFQVKIAELTSRAKQYLD